MKTIVWLRIIRLLVLVATLQLAAYADSVPIDDGTDQGTPIPRFSTNDLSYVVLTCCDDKDDTHVEFLISIRYLLVSDWFSRRKSNLWPDRFFFVYNGLYDFYAFSSDDGKYESGPVISRLQNPGFVFDWRFGALKNHELRTGWYHESNGQSLGFDPNDPNDDGLRRYLQEVRINGQEVALDQISRGWDYFPFRYTYVTPNSEQYNSNWRRFQAEFRWYCDCEGFFSGHKREEQIWWPPMEPDTKITDYDGFRFQYEHGIGDRLLLRTNLKAGTRDFDAHHQP